MVRSRIVSGCYLFMSRLTCYLCPRMTPVSCDDASSGAVTALSADDEKSRHAHTHSSSTAAAAHDAEREMGEISCEGGTVRMNSQT